MPWPEAARFAPSEGECPDCGADHTRNGDRAIGFTTRFVVDGGLRVVFEAACPCGWEDTVSIASSGGS